MVQEQVFAPYILQRDAGNARYYSEVLSSLRRGHQNDAFDSLEKSLDLALLSLETLPRSPASDDIRIRNAITEAKNYRADHPSKTQSPEIESRLQKVLLLAE